MRQNSREIFLLFARLIFTFTDCMICRSRLPFRIDSEWIVYAKAILIQRRNFLVLLLVLPACWDDACLKPGSVGIFLPTARPNRKCAAYLRCSRILEISCQYQYKENLVVMFILHKRSQQAHSECRILRPLLRILPRFLNIRYDKDTMSPLHTTGILRLGSRLP